MAAFEGGLIKDESEEVFACSHGQVHEAVCSFRIFKNQFGRFVCSDLVLILLKWGVKEAAFDVVVIEVFVAGALGLG